MKKVDAIIISFFILLGIGVIAEAAYVAHEMEIKQPQIHVPHIVWD
jgi:hypothetical protein